MGKKESRSTTDSSMALNSRTFTDWFTRLQILACSVFEWENLPPGISPIFIEKVLFREGKAVFIKDKSLGFMILRVNKAGELNVYEEAIRYQAFSYGYNELVAKEDCILIRNNLLEYATKHMIELYAERLTDIDMTISTNLSQFKKPVLILCGESELFSMKQLMMKVEGNEPFIFGTKNIDLDQFKVLNLNVPFYADKLQEMKETIINELNTRLGFNNANTDKKERMIVDEVNSNNEVISMNYQTMLSTREKACEEINKKFGLNIKVKLRFKEEETEPGAQDRGEVHNNDKDTA
jgi:hypothetical protein